MYFRGCATCAQQRLLQATTASEKCKRRLRVGTAREREQGKVSFNTCSTVFARRPMQYSNWRMSPRHNNLYNGCRCFHTTFSIQEHVRSARRKHPISNEKYSKMQASCSCQLGIIDSCHWKAAALIVGIGLQHEPSATRKTLTFLQQQNKASIKMFSRIFCHGGGQRLQHATRGCKANWVRPRNINGSFAALIMTLTATPAVVGVLGTACEVATSKY